MNKNENTIRHFRAWVIVFFVTISHCNGEDYLKRFLADPEKRRILVASFGADVEHLSEYGNIDRFESLGIKIYGIRGHRDSNFKKIFFVNFKGENNSTYLISGIDFLGKYLNSIGLENINNAKRAEVFDFINFIVSGEESLIVDQIYIKVIKARKVPENFINAVKEAQEKEVVDLNGESGRVVYAVNNFGNIWLVSMEFTKKLKVFRYSQMLVAEAPVDGPNE